MNERWVCKRCFADNEARDGSCRQCGLARGSEATPADQATWAAQTEAAKPSGRPPWLRFWWVPVLAISLVVGYVVSVRRDDSGAISSGGTLSIEDLQVGDCFTLAEEGEEDAVSEVDAKPCREAHEYELFHVATWSDSASGYPTEDAMLDFIVAECVPAFERYVGTGFQQSQLDFVQFVPLEEGWDAGDRVFQCALYDPASAHLTESLEGAER
jgi:Septum formation